VRRPASTIHGHAGTWVARVDCPSSRSAGGEPTDRARHTSNPTRWPWSVTVEPLLVVPHMENAPPVEAIGVAARSMSQQSHIRLSEERYERAVEAIAGVAR
jgi:hypothetical protein